MEHAYRWILKWGGGTAFVIIIAWPCLALPAGVFSKGYFTFWVIISIVWGLVRARSLPCVLEQVLIIPLPRAARGGLLHGLFHLLGHHRHCVGPGAHALPSVMEQGVFKKRPWFTWVVLCYGNTACAPSQS